MTTKFDVGEEVFIKAVIIKIEVDEYGSVDYKCQIKATNGVMFPWVTENKMLKMPEEVKDGPES